MQKSLLILALLIALPGFGQKTTGHTGGTGHGHWSPGAPKVNLSATSLNFGSITVGQTSAAQVVTLTNTGSLSLAITSIVTTGNFGNTTSCGGSLASGSSCTISVTFSPLSTAALTGATTITDSASGSPHVISLSGLGGAASAPIVQLSSSSLTFPGQQENTTSQPQTVVLSNVGTASLTITSIVTSGVFANTTTCGGTLAVGANCNISITFTPTSVASFSASTTITDNASGSPHVISLSGTGVSAPSVPTVNLSVSSLSFGSVVQGVTSSGQIVTLTNTGTATLTSLVIAASGDFAETTGCASTVAAGANCITTVTFTPTTTGARSGNLTFTNNAAGSPQTVTLSGTGTSPATPDCGLTSDSTLCGNVGSVTPLTSPTNLVVCNTNLTAGNYILTGNVGADPTIECLGTSFPSGAVNIDLGAFTVTGWMSWNTNHLSGTIIQNGTITCNKGAGCLQVQGGDTPSSLTHIHHLTVNQSAFNGWAIFASWQPTAVGTPTPGIRMDHLDGTCDPGGQPASNRNTCFYFQGPYVGVEQDHNLVVMPATAAACQGIVAFEAPNSLIHNNNIQLQDPMTISGDSCRGILMDSEGKYGAAGTGGNSSAYNNWVTAGPNRAIRVRSELGDIIHDNTVKDCNLAGRLGCFHVGENDVSTEAASATIYNNVIELKAGNGMVSTGDQNVTITAYGMTITCVAGDCSSAGFVARTDALIAGQQGAVLNIKNSTLPGGFGNAVGFCGTGAPLTCTINTAVSSGSACNTGTVVKGAGTNPLTPSAPCP